MSLMLLVGLDDLIAEEAGRYMNLYRKSHFINIADAIIAATASARGATLYTLSNRHFPMTDVEVIKPY
jgi:predicted nucleic acid-binding protein